MGFDKIFGKKTTGFDMNNTLSKNFGLENKGFDMNNTLSKNFGLGNNQKGASMKMQSMWANMTTPQRAQMRRTHRDSDGDGVPDKWDCQPYNKMKQDSDGISVYNNDTIGAAKKLLDDYQGVGFSWGKEAEKYNEENDVSFYSEYTIKDIIYIEPDDVKIIFQVVEVSSDGKRFLTRKVVLDSREDGYFKTEEYYNKFIDLLKSYVKKEKRNEELSKKSSSGGMGPYGYNMRGPKYARFFSPGGRW